MGFRFGIENANIVAYLTSETTKPPRLTWGWLFSFLSGAVHSGTMFFGRDPQRIDAIGRTCREARDNLHLSQVDEFIAPFHIASILEPLRREFANYALYALLVDDRRDPATSMRVKAAAESLAYRAEGECLVLIPVQKLRSTAVLDPFPPIVAAADNFDRWPGLAVWNRDTAVFVSADDVEVAVATRRSAVKRPIHVQLPSILRSAGTRDGNKTLLHLSDLHFGSDDALQNQALLEAELFDVVRTADRVVITGDLFDNPTPNAAIAYKNFSMGLERMTGKRPVAIPGNHDQRYLGNIGPQFRELARLDWSSYEADKESGFVFIGFNSSEEGKFARGRISKEQLKRVGTSWRNALATRPEEAELLPVVLVHHHPFSFRVAERTRLQRILGLFGGEEAFMKMENSSEFIKWCSAWRVPLVLHGHKHVPRHYLAHVEGQNIAAIGCGSSLGAEQSPVSYNLLTWNAQVGRWTASFYSSVDGRPFTRDTVLINSIDAPFGPEVRPDKIGPPKGT